MDNLSNKNAIWAQSNSGDKPKPAVYGVHGLTEGQMPGRM